MCESPGNCFLFSKHKRNSALNMIVNQFPYLVAIIPTILLDTVGRRCFHKTRRETFYMLLRIPRSSVSFHPDFPLVDSHHYHHHREGLKPIDHVLDYSGPVACQTLSGTEPFPCICQPVDRFSFFPKRSPLRSSSRTISRERSRINPISSLERSFLPCCLMAAFLIINFPSLTEEIAERREISLPWYCRSGCY